MAGAGTWLRFLLAVLACWRVTHLLAAEDGPADVFARLRARLGNSLLGRLMDCFQCLSLWVAAPLAFWLASGPAEVLVTWLALSGAACLLERLGPEPVVIEKMTEPKQGEERYGLLWPETGRNAHDPELERNPRRAASSGDAGGRTGAA